MSFKYHKVQIGSYDLFSLLKVVEYKVRPGINRDYSEATIILTPDSSSYINVNENPLVTISRGFLSSGEEVLIKGYITEIVEGVQSYTLKVKGYRYFTTKNVGNYSYDAAIDPSAGVISAIYSNIISRFTDLNVYDVETSTAEYLLNKFILNEDFVSERLEKLREIVNYDHFYDFNNDGLVFRSKGSSVLSTVLSVGINILNNFDVGYNKEQIINDVTIIGNSSEVETTITGRTGVDTGYDSTGVLLAHKPVSVKVWNSDSEFSTSNEGTLMVGGVQGSTVSFDYYVDKLNNKIIWNSTFTAGTKYIKIAYSYLEPIKVRGFDPDSKAIYGTRSHVYTFLDIEEVEDAITRLNNIIEEYKNPKREIKLSVANVQNLNLGDYIRVVNNNTGFDEQLIIKTIVYTYPSNADNIVVGDDVKDFSSIIYDFNDRIRRLEREQSLSQELVVQVNPIVGNIIMEQLNTTITKNGSTERVLWLDGIYVERFINNDFEGSGTADWDTTNEVLKYD